MSEKTISQKVSELKKLKTILDHRFENLTQRELKGSGLIGHKEIFDIVKRKSLKGVYNSHFHFARSMYNRKQEGLLKKYLKDYIISFKPVNNIVICSFRKKYSKSDYRTSGKSKITDDKTLVTSNQERIIYNLLKKEGINFEFEPVIKENGIFMSPDFKITSSSNSNENVLIYWEHFGMQENVNYDKDIQRRIEKYIKLGYSFSSKNKRLVITYGMNDSSLIREVQKQIKIIKNIYNE